MTKLLIISLFIFVLGILLRSTSLFNTTSTTNGAPPYDPSTIDNVSESEEASLIANWKRPVGPTKVALQVGHWKTDEIPNELQKLKGNSGAQGGGKSEWEVNYAIAEKTKELLEAKGITVELLPATIPHAYWADIFVAIHADGHPDTTKTGFKAAIPRRDYTQKADELLASIREAYGNATGLTWDEETITRNMRGYYAFSWWRYEHAVHPMTTALILETGFLTSPSDQRIIINNPQLPAEGLASGIINYLHTQDLL